MFLLLKAAVWFAEGLRPSWPRRSGASVQPQRAAAAAANAETLGPWTKEDDEPREREGL